MSNLSDIPEVAGPMRKRQKGKKKKEDWQMGTHKNEEQDGKKERKD